MSALESTIATALSSPQAARAALIDISRIECEESLAEFVRQAWAINEPGTPLLWNWHLDVVCAYLEAYYERRIKRLILNIPPGSMKSFLVSVLGPAWAWTKWPSRRYINLTNELGLATRDSLRMRNVVQSDWYQERWGDKVQISTDQREKTLFENTARGFRQGLGITGSITGKRGTDLLIDDPLDAKKAFSDAEIANVNDTYDQAVSSRLNDPVNDGIVLIMQRLRDNDLTGHLLAKKQQRWTLVKIEMEYEGQPGYDPVADLGPEYAHLADPRKKKGELLFPQRFPKPVVEALKEDLGEYGTAGQLQQRPSPLGGGIIKRNWWREWPKDKRLPPPLHIFASIDTAFSQADHKKAAYSARTTWMVFEDEQTGKHAMLLLSAWWERVGYPELRKAVKDHYRKDDLDCALIERKASGISLIQDLRRIRTGRMNVRGFDPGKLDKTARAYLASPMFEAGLVYYPEGREWAKKVVDYVSSFPTGAPPSADLTDTVTQAVLYTKRRMWAQPPDEDPAPQETETNTEEWDEDHADQERESAYG